MPSSTLACLGLGVADEDELDQLVTRLLPDSSTVSRYDDMLAQRWTDPGGASLTMVVREGSLVDLVPSVARPLPTRLRGLAAHGRYASADVLDADGGTATRLCCDLAQGLLRTVPGRVEGTITALGVDVAVHADAAAFGQSGASRLERSGDRDDGGHDPPTRLTPESLLPYGLFGDPADASPTAFVAGTVVAAQTRTTETTGARFHLARARVVGTELWICLDASEHPDPPPPGAVVAGTCYLVADVAAVETDLDGVPRLPRKRRWLPRRRP